MIHGVIVASHGDALHWGLNKFDAVDFTQEVWSFVVPGTWVPGRISKGDKEVVIIYIWGFPKMLVPNNHGFSY